MKLEVTFNTKELTRNLEQTGQTIQSVLGRAVHAGAEVAQKEVSARAPRKKGVLAGDIIIEDKDKSKVSATAIVKPGKRGWYGRILEGGAKAHTIKAKAKKLLSNGNHVFGAVVQHPGIRKRPFMQPAFEAKQDAIRDAVQRVIFSVVK